MGKYIAYWCASRGSILEMEVTERNRRVDSWCRDRADGDWLIEGGFVIPQAIILDSSLKTKRNRFDEYNLRRIAHPLGIPPILPKGIEND